MRTRSVIVVHREAMVAEGIAMALGSYPGILPVAVATTAEEAEACADRVDAVALDEQLPGAAMTAARLRRGGMRVVLVGNGRDPEEGVSVSTSSSVASLAAALVPGAGASSAARSTLSPREREVLALVAKGLAGKQVAKHLGISPKTVEQHKSRIFSKLGVPNQAAAVSLALSTDVLSAELRSGTWISSSM